MAKIVESHADDSHDNIGTLDADLPHADKDLKSEWDDTAMYQIPDQREKIHGVSNSEANDQSKSSTTDGFSFHHDPHDKISPIYPRLSGYSIYQGKLLKKQFMLPLMKTHSFIHDQVDHSSSILNELTYGPSDPVLELLPCDAEPVVPNVDQLISSQSISEDQTAIPEEAEP
uniref:Uncharacterized protein n=1 Tax=Lactuca sativa TaxID=4236 RepID=A0A9R1VHK0_LACSA|nr:hypothetical protein LSAT_V11C500260180 [Lactuca sativa]